MRIVTLTPGATEIAIALGLESAIIAAGPNCRIPDRVRGVQRVDFGAAHGAPMAEVIADRVAALNPNAVLATNLPNEISERLQSVPNLTVIDLAISSIDELFDGIRLAGEGLGAGSAAKLALRGLSYRKRRIETITDSVQHDARPRVLFLEALSPLLGAGYWNPELVALAGGRNLHGKPGVAPRRTQLEHISVLDPDVIFVAASHAEFGTVRSMLDQIADAHSDWGVLRAIAHDRVFIAEATGAFDTPGPSMIDGLEVLAYTLHPHRHRTPTSTVNLLHVKRDEKGLLDLTSPTDE
ncbi:MAG: ABC transporter substrate-binding protein [Pseudomonadota bacterium]